MEVPGHMKVMWLKAWDLVLLIFMWIPKHITKIQNIMTLKNHHATTVVMHLPICWHCVLEAIFI